MSDLKATHTDLIPRNTTYYSISRAGLSIADDTPPEIMQQLGKDIVTARNACQWLLGDWLNEAEARYGEMYAQFIEQTGYSAQTLYNTKWVASRFEISRRRENLSFSHHAAVASLEPELSDSLLEKAEQGQWSAKELRNAAGTAKIAYDQSMAEAEAPAKIEPDADHCIVTKEEYERTSTTVEESTPSGEDVGGPTDKLGEPIPNQQIAEDFERAVLIRGLETKIKELRDAAATMHDNEDRLLAHIAWATWTSAINDALRVLQYAAPYAICRYCGGDGCQRCKHTGWVGKLMYKQGTPDALKKEDANAT
jgi:hypothetical protein